MFRTLTSDDVQAIVGLQFDSFAATYSDVFSDNYMRQHMALDIARHWENWPVSKRVVGALDQGKLVGFATYLMNRDPCYLDNFHIAQSHYGTGLSQALFLDGARIIAKEGATALCLTVLETNARARAFYEKLGGREGPLLEDEMLGHKVMAYSVNWTELPGAKKNADKS